MSKPGKLPTGGAFQTAPAGAPKQVSQPLSPAAVREMEEKARANEKPLAPLVFDPPIPAPDPAPDPPPDPSMVVPADQLTPGPGGPTGAELEGEFAAATAGSNGGDPEPKIGTRRPAESNTDSPSRGVPRPILDPGKQIQGGWGPSGGNQYFALSGLELQTVVQELMSSLIRQAALDLRMGIACVYPQVRVRVQVLIDGSSPDAAINDASFNLDAARLVTLEAAVQDDPDSPADAIRDEIGLAKPAKRLVASGAGSVMVDVPS